MLRDVQIVENQLLLNLYNNHSDSLINRVIRSLTIRV